MIKMGVPPNSLLGKVGKKNPQKESKKMAEKMFTICIEQNLRLFPFKFLHKNQTLPLPFPKICTKLSYPT
jgi:hypothetical protein